MNSSELLAVFRSEMSDTVAPFLWSDEEVFGFQDDAQQQFCRKTNGIIDARTAVVTQLAIVPGTDWYTTHASILNIRKATRADTGREVELLTAEQADRRGLYFLATQLGLVKHVVLGLEPHAVRIHPMPNETVTLNLSVCRLPLLPITDAGEQAFEIDAMHHLGLLLWMKHRAYDKQDAETFDRRKSDDFAARFVAYCDRAKLEQERARRARGVTAYGGL
jgi:hypothetical protein